MSHGDFEIPLLKYKEFEVSKTLESSYSNKNGTNSSIVHLPDAQCYATYHQELNYFFQGMCFVCSSIWIASLIS